VCVCNDRTSNSSDLLCCFEQANYKLTRQHTSACLANRIGILSPMPWRKAVPKKFGIAAREI
jgi:hypothetical protein